MEDVLETYKLPYDEKRPVICLDETSQQLIGEVQGPLPIGPGKTAVYDHEYVRNGVADLFMMVEPLSGHREVKVTESRTKKDFAGCLRDMAERFEIHHTPKHGSALNMAELEIGIVNRQCLNRRIPTIEEMSSEVAAWVAGRNKEQTKIHWQFTTQDARIKLQHLYQKF
jgi:hypothetical protein